ncbi:hypothetical protein IV70_GL001855 [Carnobacterium maltaromaticum DSM 20342]|nr:hypothetical protein IV70_GL001855 [Carnobacterium maltaromaticum DSM 20342]
MELEEQAMNDQSKKDSTPEEVTIKCTKCKKTNHDTDANYCENCGNKLEFTPDEILLPLLKFASSLHELTQDYLNGILSQFKTEKEARDYYKEVSASFRSNSKELGNADGDLRKHNFDMAVVLLIGYMTFEEE